MRHRLAQLLRRIAAWLDAPPEGLPTAILQAMHEARKFAKGTDGEFKRRYVLAKLKKAYPAIPTSTLALTLEQTYTDHAPL